MPQKRVVPRRDIQDPCLTGKGVHKTRRISWLVRYSEVKSTHRLLIASSRALKSRVELACNLIRSQMSLVRGALLSTTTRHWERISNPYAVWAEGLWESVGGHCSDLLKLNIPRVCAKASPSSTDGRCKMLSRLKKLFNSGEDSVAAMGWEATGACPNQSVPA